LDGQGRLINGGNGAIRRNKGYRMLELRGTTIIAVRKAGQVALA
jgi:hypothetical protein